MSKERDYYQILQVSRDATLEEIKQAFRDLARQHHPDLNPTNPLASETFKQIVEAYEFLCEQYRETSPPLSEQQAMPKAQKAHNLYVQGIRKTLERDYPGAIADYTQAIDLSPAFIDAYLKRSEARYTLGDDRGVLEDCHQVLQLDLACTQAHYYRGRSRYRLGYTQSAIQAYGQALQYQPDYGIVYYHRALSYLDLQDLQSAQEDLQTAINLFRQQGDESGYRLAKETLRQLQPKNRIFSALLRNFHHSWKTLLTVLINPGDVSTAFSRLDSISASGVGITLAIVANGCFVTTIYLSWQDLIPFSLVNLGIVGLIPFITLVGLHRMLCLFCRYSGNFSGDIFLAGTSLVPVGLLALASSFSQILGSGLMVVLTVFTFSYTLLILYTGNLQLNQVQESIAAFSVSLMILISGWLTYCIARLLLGI